MTASPRVEKQELTYRKYLNQGRTQGRIPGGSRVPFSQQINEQNPYEKLRKKQAISEVDAILRSQTLTEVFLSELTVLTD